MLAKSMDLDVRFVIGADGHRSRVRRVLKADFPEVSPAQHYAVFEFQTDAELGEELRIVLAERTTDILWPLPGRCCRWSFELPDYHDPAERQKDRLFGSPGSAEYPVLTAENLKALLTARAPWFTGSIGEITWRNVVRSNAAWHPVSATAPVAGGGCGASHRTCRCAEHEPRAGRS